MSWGHHGHQGEVPVLDLLDLELPGNTASWQPMWVGQAIRVSAVEAFGMAARSAFSALRLGDRHQRFGMGLRAAGVAVVRPLWNPWSCRKKDGGWEGVD